MSYILLILPTLCSTTKIGVPVFPTRANTQPYQPLPIFRLGEIMTGEKSLVAIFICIQAPLYWTSLCLWGLTEINILLFLLLIFLLVASFLLIYKISLYIKEIHHFSVPLLATFISICYLPSDLVYISCASHFSVPYLRLLAFKKLFFIVVNKCMNLSLYLYLGFVIILSKIFPFQISHAKSQCASTTFSISIIVVKFLIHLKFLLWQICTKDYALLLFRW